MTARLPLPLELAGRSFTYKEGRSAGLGEGRLRGQDLARPFHGIRSSVEAPDDLLERCRAIAPTLPPGSFFSSATAALLMRIPLPHRHRASDSIHIAVISPHRALEGMGVVGHKIQLMGDDWWLHEGLPISTPERAWCELGVLLSIPELVAAGDWMVSRQAALTDHERLGDVLRKYPDRRRKRSLRIAGDLLDGRSESPKESELRAILALGGIDGMQVNWPVRVARFNYRLDLAIPTRMIALEYEGDYHREQAQWRRDMTRASRLEADGWAVIHLNADDLHDPRELVARVRRTIAARPLILR